LIYVTAKCCDLHRQVAVFDNSPRPNDVHDLVPGHELTRPSDQKSENLERAGADHDRDKGAALITSREAAAIQAKVLEQEHVGCRQRVHASASHGEHEQVSSEAAPRL
jgi:hypothetical protein